MKTARTIAISAVVAGLATFILGWVYIARATADPGSVCTFQCTPPAPLDCLVSPARCDLPPATASTWQDLLLLPTHSS